MNVDSDWNNRRNGELSMKQVRFPGDMPWFPAYSSKKWKNELLRLGPIKELNGHVQMFILTMEKQREIARIELIDLAFHQVSLFLAVSEKGVWWD